MEELFCTGHGGNIYNLDNKSNIVDFSANINPFGLPERAAKVLVNVAGDCICYPDPNCRELCHALSEYENIPPQWLLCGNGAADLIFRIAYGLKPKYAMVLAPTFSEYEQALLQSGGTVIRHQLKSSENFLLTESILDSLKAQPIDILFLCNPNNPTGSLIEKSLLLRILALCKKRQITVVMDECFLDFTENNQDYTLKSELSTMENLIILKAFTKFFGMAGIRLGYIMTSNFRFKEAVFLAGQPWSVSTPAQQCGIAALGDTDYISKTKVWISTERDFLSKELQRLSIHVFDSRTNFLLFFTDITDLDKKLLAKNIMIRNCQNYYGLSDGYFRIAVKSHSDNQKLITAMTNLLMEEQLWQKLS